MYSEQKSQEEQEGKTPAKLNMEQDETLLADAKETVAPLLRNYLCHLHQEAEETEYAAQNAANGPVAPLPSRRFCRYSSD